MVRSLAIGEWLTNRMGLVVSLAKFVAMPPGWNATALMPKPWKRRWSSRVNRTLASLLSP